MAGEDEDLSAFMSKWEAGLQAPLAKTMKESRSEKGESQDQPAPQVSSFEELDSREEMPVIPKSRAAISPAEAARITGLVEKLLITAQKSPEPLLSLSLEVKGSKGVEPLMIPVRLKNLYQGMVVLEVNNPKFVNKAHTLHQKKKATLHLQGHQGQESLKIKGTMAWKRSMVDGKINIYLSIRSVQRDEPASKVLENALPAASKDALKLWNLWDKSQALGESASVNKSNIYLMLVASGAIASSFIDPMLAQSMRFLLSGLAILKIKNLIR